MSNKYTIGLLTGLTAIIVGVVIISLQSRSFEKSIQIEKTLFLQSPQTFGVLGRDAAKERKDVFDKLPGVVRRYLEVAIGEVSKSAPPRVVIATQSGTFRASPRSEAKSFTAEEIFSAERAQYLWSAQISSGPLLWTRVRDFYLMGRGEVQAKFLSSFEVAKYSGPEISQGALIRWAAEAIWFPQVFLNTMIFSWTPIDETSAMATVRDASILTHLVFKFGADGLPSSITSTERTYNDGERLQVLPWVATLGEWKRLGGVLVPTQTSASWKLKDGEFEYIKVKVTELSFQY